MPVPGSRSVSAQGLRCTRGARSGTHGKYLGIPLMKSLYPMPLTAFSALLGVWPRLTAAVVHVHIQYPSTWLS